MLALHILHFIKTPDIEALAAGTGRAGQVHAWQGVEQGGDIVGLLALDVGAVDVRAPGRAGADGVASAAASRVNRCLLLFIAILAEVCYFMLVE